MILDIIASLFAVSLGSVTAEIDSATALSTSGNHLEAIDALTQVIERKDLPPSHLVLALQNRAFASINAGQFAAARDDAERGIGIALNVPSAAAYLTGLHNNLGLALGALEFYSEAIEAYSEGIRLAQPDSLEQATTLYSNRAVAHRFNGDLASALDDVTTALSDDPYYSFALKERYRILDAQGDYDQALGALYDGVRRSIDEKYWFLNELAWVLATCEIPEYRDGKAAIEYAILAREHVPVWKSKATEMNVLDTLAAAYAEYGKFDSAAETQTLVVAHFGDSEKYQAALDSYIQRKPVRGSCTTGH